ncbi:uncharacterized protein THITE_2128775 [Thermothielavioides terrestris NRRL 8126]|uniref:Uncharacterized protein n=1 Tax=Thermothielavioides terrestris (strain ATCC 38088 / NRRL 8126) TaxID=578455 RepID=G2R3F9_THETT|nr:uncharacterized protein THITE_2128775 [Thermothielavioides terrestris NRRL 8126]AEO66769.1 hypothetical protein THITE_2128775 [Thermothielavioides terrestris NRRL 8126]
MPTLGLLDRPDGAQTAVRRKHYDGMLLVNYTTFHNNHPSLSVVHLLRHLCKAEPTNVGFPVNKRHRHPIPADLRGKPLSRSHQKPLDMTMQRQRDVRTTQRVPKDIGTPWSINFLRKYQPNLGRWLTFLQRFQTDHCADRRQRSSNGVPEVNALGAAGPKNFMEQRTRGGCRAEFGRSLALTTPHWGSYTLTRLPDVLALGTPANRDIVPPPWLAISTVQLLSSTSTPGDHVPPPAGGFATAI